MQLVLQQECEKKLLPDKRVGEKPLFRNPQSKNRQNR